MKHFFLPLLAAVLLASCSSVSRHPVAAVEGLRNDRPLEITSTVFGSRKLTCGAATSWRWGSFPTRSSR